MKNYRVIIALLLRFYVCLCVWFCVLPMAWAATTEQQILEVNQQIEQKTANIKTAMQNKESDKAKALRSERTELQKQLRELKQQERDEKKEQEKIEKRAAAERQWETFEDDRKLCSAIEYNRFDLVKKVLDNPNTLDLTKPIDPCFYPLGDAAARGHADIVEYLLEKKSPLAMRMPQLPVLLSALDAAAARKEDRTDILNILKQHGAKPNDSREESLPGAIVSEGDAESDAYLKQKYNVDREELTQGGSLVRALDKGHPNNVRWLLANGASPHEISLGRSMLMAAVESNSLEKVKILVEAGADVNQRGINFSSVLRQAEKHLEVVSKKKKPEMEQIIAYLKSQGATYSEQELTN